MRVSWNIPPLPLYPAWPYENAQEFGSQVVIGKSLIEVCHMCRIRDESRAGQEVAEGSQPARIAQVNGSMSGAPLWKCGLYDGADRSSLLAAACSKRRG
jgi:hypothetical protein